MPIEPKDGPILQMTAEQIARFWSYVDASGGPDACHPWTGGTKAGSTSGRRRVRHMYGRLKLGVGCDRFAHRIAWVLTNGPPPAESPLLDHICRNTLCVNVRHLRPCTNRENTVDFTTASFCGRNASKTHCLRGHELSGPNMYTEITRSGRTGRKCIACRDERSGRLRAELAGASARGGSRPPPEQLAEVMRVTGSCVKAAFVLGVSDRSVANWCNDDGIGRLRRAIRRREATK